MLSRRTLRSEMVVHHFREQLGACSVWDTKQELGDVSSCLDVGKRCVAESCAGAGAAAAELQCEQCLSMGGRCRKSIASVSGTALVLAV